MADEEVVSVKLTSDSKGFVKGFNEAAQAVGNVTKAGGAMVKGFQFAAAQVEREVSRMTSTIKKVSATIAGVGVSTSIIGGLGLKNFSQMQTAMANVATVTDTTRVSVAGLQNTLMKLTAVFPRTGEELAAGLYEVQSAGFQGAEALSVMDAATRFSVAGIVDMGTSVRATTGLMNAYGISAYDAIHVTDILFKAVEEGQMTASEFAINIGDWAASASSLGVSMESASAALAVMTTKGAMPANLAATSLNSMMRNLIRPTETMSDALKRMGFDSGKAALNTLGFAETLGALWQQAGKNETKFADMFQDVEGFRGALGLVTEGYEKLLDTQARFNSRAETDGTTQTAFEKQMDTLSSKFALFRNEMRKFSYEVGRILAPIAEGFLDITTNILKFFNSMPQWAKSIFAFMRLLGPTIAAVGVWLTALWVKSKILELALRPLLGGIASLAMAAGNLTGSTGPARAIGFLGMSFEKMKNNGGVLATVRQQIVKFIAADTALRASMLRTVAAGAMWVGGLAALGFGIYKAVGAFQDASKNAEKLFDTFGDAQSKAFTPLADLETHLARVNSELEKVKYLQGDSLFTNIGRGLAAGLQVINPFDSNTYINDLRNLQEGLNEQELLRIRRDAMMNLVDLQGEVNGELYKKYQEGVISRRDFEDQMIQVTETGLQKAIETGNFDWEKYLSNYMEYERILKEAAESGSPEEFDAIMTSDRMKEVSAAITDADAALERFMITENAFNKTGEDAGVAAERLSRAIFAIGDEASTAEDKLEAFKTIIDEVFGTKLDERDLISNLAENMTKLGVAMRDGGANFDLWSEGGQELQSVMSAAGKSFREYLKYIAEHNGPNGVNMAAQEIVNMTAQLQTMGQEFGWTSDQVNQMIEIMGLTPENIQTYLSVPGLTEEMARLLTTQNILAQLDGTVATASVIISVGTNVIQNVQRGAGTFVGPPAPVQGLTGPNLVDAYINNMKAAAESALKAVSGAGGGGGKGGGGGGGGAAKWRPTTAQLRNMRAALSAPLTNLLEGEFGAEWQKMAVSRWFDAVTKNIFMEGKTRLGASILKEAQASGQDPSAEFEDMVQEYGRLVGYIGKASADLALNQFDTLDSFSAFVDKMEELVEHQRDVEDWKYSIGKMGFEEYRKILTARLAKYEEYTSEWMDITDQLKSLQEDQLREEDRMMSARLELEEISEEEYITYLKRRLVALEKYSEEWMDIWGQINDAEERLIEQQEERSRGIKDFADSVKDAFDDIKRSVEDPIRQATSLLSAFGDQATITQDQVTGFYQHMLEGTQRWVTVIRELKSRGINSNFLNDLIQAGPQSLTFAEGVLALGSDGISMINTSMNEISNLASGLGTDIAKGQVGTLIQNNNSVSITVGDVTVTGEFDEGLSIADVQQAIESALMNVAVSVQNQQAAPLTRAPSTFSME
jgi:TP901 family phage tail tape measure protein